MKSLCDHELNPREQYICKSHQRKWDFYGDHKLSARKSQEIFPDTGTLLSTLFSCGKNHWDDSYSVYQSNCEELAWIKVHLQKSSVNATTPFCDLRQSDTTKIWQMASVVRDDVKVILCKGTEIAIS